MQLEHSLKRKWNSSPILILGRGYIGLQMEGYLLSQGYKVLAINRNEVDYHDYSLFRKTILNNGIGLVINCSGFTGRPNVDRAEIEKELCWKLNVVSPLQVATACDDFGVPLIHISSGCIYNGYAKDFTEEDTPNFGIYDVSSFYSKSKHALETLTTRMDIKILRIRMPVCHELTNPRNYLNKITKYKNLINYRNSKTFIPDLCGFINALITSDVSWIGQDIYNVVNPNPLTTKEVVGILNLDENNFFNMNPNWVEMDDIDIVAPRSNCVLDGTKASKYYRMRTETEVLWTIINQKNGVKAA